MVKIRLAQTGSKNRRTYRLVAIEEGKRRGGKAIEILGYYNPLITPPARSIRRDRVDYWLSVGAQISSGAQKILGEKSS